MTRSDASTIRASPLALVIAGMSAAVGVVMFIRSRQGVKGNDDESEALGPAASPQALNSMGGQSSSRLTSSTATSDGSLTVDISTTGLPPSLVKKNILANNTAGRQRYWLDEQIGLCIDFPFDLLEVTKEERRSPALLVKFKALKEPSTTVCTVIEQCAELNEADTLLGRETTAATITPRSYQESCLSKLEDCAKILSRDDVSYRGSLVPSLYYCYEAGPTNTIFYVRSIFFSHRYYAAMVQVCSKHPMKAMPTGILPSLRWIAPRPSPSCVVCAEPRFGLGFSLPIHFQLHRSDEFMPDAPRSITDESPSSCIWGELMTSDDKQVVVARYERYPQTQWQAKDLAPKIVKRCVDGFGIRSMPAVVSEGPSPKGYHISFRPMTLTMSHDGPSAQRLEGLCGATAVVIDTDPSFADFDDTASSISSRQGSSPPTRRGNIHSPTTSTQAGTLIIYLFAVRREFVSFAFLNKDPKVSASQFSTFANTTINTLSFGNHLGQDTACVYRNLRHGQHFAVTLPSHTKIIEPGIGDPLVIFQLAGLQHHVLYIRPFSAPTVTVKNAHILLPQLERKMLSLLYMLPGRCKVDTCRHVEYHGMYGFEIIHSHDLLLDVSGDEIDELDESPTSLHGDEEEETLSTALSEEQSIHGSNSPDSLLRRQNRSTTMSTSTATTTDIGGEEFALDNPLSQFDYSQLLDLQNVELADEPQEGDTVSRRLSIVLFHEGVAYLFRICSSPYMFEQARKTIGDIVRNFSFIEDEARM